MLKRSFALIVASLVLLAGCATAGSSSSAAADSSTPATESILSETVEMLENQYPELEVVASLQNKMAVLPGQSIPVTVAIKNAGDKTISFAMGSGSFTTPTALSIRAEGLETATPKDHLGLATRDMQYASLAPGETLSYQLHLMAIELSTEYADNEFEAFTKDSTYLPDLQPDELAAKYPGLTFAAAGAYEGNVTFAYTILEDGKTLDATGNPTGFNTASFSFTIA